MHDYILQPATGLKPPLQVLFWKCSEEKGCSKISKIPKTICKSGSSSLTLQACSIEFPASIKHTSRKNSAASALK